MNNLRPRPQLIAGLHWVRGELEQSITRARTLIDQFAEAGGDSLKLQQAYVELHQVRGTAAMIQCHGMVAVAAEMGAALQDLIQDRIAEPEPLYSALLGATIQLGDYIQALAEGTPDCVLVMQPTINELRLARGQPVLTESELFVAQMQAMGLALVPPEDQALLGGAAQQQAQRLLPVFRASLLAWIRDAADAQAGAARVGKVGELIAQHAVHGVVYQLWRIAAAAIEACLARGIVNVLELKRLFGRLGVQLKLLAEGGEGAAAAQAGDLSLQLLFLVGRSTAHGVRVEALRQAFSLDRHLPRQESLDRLRRRIHGPSTALLAKVADEIRKDFSWVKDQIDLMVRTGAGASAADTAVALERIGHTLAALGLSRLQQVVAGQARQLTDQAHAGSGPTPASPNVWIELATSILRVENDLEEALFRQMHRQQDGAVDEVSDDIPASRDLSEGREALYREFLINLARIKSAADTYLKTGGSGELPEAVLLIDEIASGFEVLGKSRVAEFVRRLRNFVASRTFAGLRATTPQAERFADIVAAVEYYIEAARAGLPTAEDILDELERLVASVDIGPPEVPAVDTLLEVAATEPAIAVELTTVAEPDAAAAVPAPPAAGDEDPEIREIFLEEAAEVLAALQSAFAAWNRDSQNRDALTTLRRAFHTLKGSGRTVGAAEIGEFSWALENLLNKCLDGSVLPSPGIVETVGRGVAVLPELVEAFRERRAAPETVSRVTADAAEYAAGRTAGAAPEPDIVLVFRDDAGEKIAAVSAWLGQHADAREAAVEREVVRAFHTIRGAARVVEARAISDLAGALEAYLDALTEARLRLDASGLDLLREASATLHAWIGEVGTAAAIRQDAAAWLQRIGELQAAVPADAVQASTDRQLTEIFAGEAFELVVKIEDSLRGWAQAPDSVRAADDLKLLCHTLLGAAQMSECLPIAAAARALHRAFAGAAAQALHPADQDFAVLAEVCEGLYQLLDAYREGRLAGDGAEWVARVEALGWAAAVESAPPQQPTDASTPLPPQELTALEAIDLEAAALPAEAGAVAEEAAGGAPSGEVIELPPLEASEAPEVDPELLVIFQAEAEELLEGLDQSVASLERDPHNLVPLGEIKRLLHTFKGSARVSGLQVLGEIAHRLESLFEQFELGQVQSVTQIFARVQNALDGLHMALDDLRRGVIPEPVAVLDELSQPLAEIILHEAPPAAPSPAPVPGARPAFASPPRPAGVPLPENFDVELAQTFAGEAEELMELLEEALPRWQALPSDYSPARDMLRALHTCKGGARMAGLTAMGEAAHELESLIEGLEYAGELDAGALKVVAGAVAELRRLTDRLQRGDYAALISVAGADEELPDEVVEDAGVPAAARPEPQPLSMQESPAFGEMPLPAPPPGMWDPGLFWRPEEELEGFAAQRRETARVPVEALDRMLNEAGEISIYRSRMEEHNAAIQAQLDDMAQAIQRVRDQLRQLDIETEAQIAARGLSQAESADRYAGEFDPLEMDRYTRMQELSRTLAESVGDLAAVHASIDQLASEATTILLQQGRVNTEVQQGMMRTLMVPFSRQVARLQRVVQQTSLENGKRADIAFDGVEAELDRNVLERMTAPLEHLLRNAVIHGIEPPAERDRAGKPATGRLQLGLWREGTQLFIELSDDGRGLDLEAIRETAVKRGLMPEGTEVSDDEAAQFIFMPGFSTARALTKDAGRGVGMDVVAAEVKQLGGSLDLASEAGKGARFKVRLPLTLAMSQSLLVDIGHETYAVPLPSIEGIARFPREQLEDFLAEDGPQLEYGGQHYRVLHLADLVGLPRETPADLRTTHAILVRLPEGIAGTERRVAVVVDQLIGSRQVVSKAVGPQISAIPGISGATILADGRVVLILDVAALVQDRTRRTLRTQAAVAHGEREVSAEAHRDLVMVVDDSITIRRVTERLLAKHGFTVITAKDGLDAMAQLQTERPDAILLDIEMPRADGFEVATFVRNTPTISDTPILMITSRSGDKHRDRARTIGVDRYLIKPYQEDELLEEVRQAIRERRA